MFWMYSGDITQSDSGWAGMHWLLSDSENDMGGTYYIGSVVDVSLNR